MPLSVGRVPIADIRPPAAPLDFRVSPDALQNTNRKRKETRILALVFLPMVEMPMVVRYGRIAAPRRSRV